jgi:hypothetical protein
MIGNALLDMMKRTVGSSDAALAGDDGAATDPRWKGEGPAGIDAPSWPDPAPQATAPLDDSRLKSGFGQWTSAWNAPGTPAWAGIGSDWFRDGTLDALKRSAEVPSWDGLAAWSRLGDQTKIAPSLADQGPLPGSDPANPYYYLINDPRVPGTLTDPVYPINDPRVPGGNGPAPANAFANAPAGAAALGAGDAAWKLAPDWQAGANGQVYLAPTASSAQNGNGF